MTMIKKGYPKIMAVLLAVILFISALPMTAFAAPAADIPSDMLDNAYLDALAYTGYDVQAQKNDGTIFKTYGSRLEGSPILSNITYGYGSSGLETTDAGLPNIAYFEKNLLCCASYTSYVYFNYLPNVAGIDTSKLTRPDNYKSAGSWNTVANKWVDAGDARRISFTQSKDGSSFTPSEEIPIGSLIVFKSIADGSIAHVALYAGAYNGTHFVIRVGNDKGPEISSIEGMSKGGLPEAVAQIVTPEFAEEDGTIEVYKKDNSGKNLSGAVFVATNITDKKQYVLGPTNASGYAFKDKIPCGDYKVVETVFPKNYTSHGQTSWNVTVSKANNGVVTINAVNELKKGYLEVVKSDAVNGKDLSGAVFTVYNASGTVVAKVGPTDANGYAKSGEITYGSYTVKETTFPTNYTSGSITEWNITINDDSPLIKLKIGNEREYGDLKVVKTAEDNFKKDFIFTLTGTSVYGEAVNMTATTDETGIAMFSHVPIGTGYVISEKDTPIRYVVPEDQTAAIEWNKVTVKTFDNTLKKFRVTVAKQDAETGSTAQGDATLAGAKYGIYNGDELIDTYTTDANGQFTTAYYVCGDNWSVREISASQGYLVNAESYPVGAEAKLYTIEYNNPALTALETIIKGKISIIKHTDDGSTQIETPEVGAQFEVYLKSSGSYAAAKETERDILTCDQYGYAVTKDLPYGEYTVHQIKGWEGKEFLEDFSVFVSENEKTYPFLINNATFESYVKIVKVDAETGKTIPVAGAGFKLYRPDVSQITMTMTYPTPATIDIFYTNDEGYLITPEVLPYGIGYALEEVQAPFGYVLDSDKQTFDITEDNSTVESAVVVTLVEKPNMSQKGTITINKSGEVFSSVTEANGIYQPVYKTAGLSGAVYEITAAEDIYTPDGTLRYSKGELVDTVTTKADGSVKSKELYLGSYDVVEKTAPYGMVLNTEVRHITLSYAGQEVSIVETATSFINDRQKAEIEIYKQMQTDKLFGLGANGELLNVVFGLYAKANLTAADGSVIPADGLIELVPMTESGKASVKTDLPLGSYYVKEYTTDESYVLDDAKYPVDFTYQGQETALVSIKTNDGNPITNTPIYGEIKGLKIDRETEQTIAGAVFGLFRVDETEFTEATAILTAESKKDGVFTFKNVAYGKWIVRELKPADGYLPNTENYPIIVAENGEIIEITVVNDRIPEIGTTAEVDGKKEINATEIFTLTDTVSYKHLIPGKEYVLKGVLMDKTTGKPLTIGGTEIVAETTFTPETASGEVIVEFVFDAKYIKTDTKLVAFETLYKDGMELAVHADIEDEGQTVTVHVPEIGTAATIDGEKHITHVGVITIEDVVRYTNLTPGKEYTVNGVLMNKATGKPFTVNGEEIRASVTFIPETANGEVTVTFVFNANGLTKATELVAFESLTRDGVEIAVHADIEDADQTVTITPPTPPAPQTGDNSNMGFWIGLGAVALGALISLLIIRKKSRKDDDDE